MGSEKIREAKGGGVNFDHPATCRPKILDYEKAMIDWGGRKKFALVGFATSSREEAPWDDPEYVIVGLNQLYRHIPRADAWLEIHANWNEHVVEGTDHAGWLAAAPIPIFMKERVAGIPNSVRFPIERAIAEFSDYFTSTVAFGIALAILEGFTTIGIYGVDLIVGTEYFSQKACVEYLLGIAVGRGIEVRLPALSALCKSTFRYGYQLEPDWGPMRLSVVEGRLAELRENHKKALARAHWLDGRLSQVEEAIRGNGNVTLEAIRERLVTERDQNLAQLHIFEGCARETDRWREYLELHQRGGTVPA